MMMVMIIVMRMMTMMMYLINKALELSAKLVPCKQDNYLSLDVSRVVLLSDLTCLDEPLVSPSQLAVVSKPLTCQCMGYHHHHSPEYQLQ